MKGPIAATISTLKDIGWRARSMDVWHDPEGEEWELDYEHEALFAEMSEELGRQIERALWRRADRHQGSHELANGADLTVAKKHRRSLMRKAPDKVPLLDVVVQGALYTSEIAGKEEVCPMCHRADTLHHRMWKCPSMLAQVGDFPPTWPVQDNCYWNRGLVPITWTTNPLPTSFEWHGNGIWEDHHMVDGANLVFATDGSGGPHSQDPRRRRVAWAVVAMTDTEPFPVVGSMWGTVEFAQTVPRAEAKALEQLLQHTTGTVRVAIDAKAVARRFHKQPQARTKPSSSNQSLWESIRFFRKDKQVPVSWTKAHLTQEEHRIKFGEEKFWQWRGNQQADELASSFASEISDKMDPTQVRQEINSWIDSRTWAIQQRLMDVVAFWLQQAREPNIRFGPKLPTVKEILSHLAETHPHHAWHANRPVCTVCGLHLRAHWRRVKIQRAIQHPCGTEVHHLVHPSHQMQSCDSNGWRCVKCGKKGTMNHLIFKHSWQQICQRQGRRRRRQL